ncbi:HET-domain-containing protein [Venturia nashicola]|uniref:HET-domain-containing protein n=1 Tax=Venturia nashicola TaxID=86259 RepID=A0A4Z1P3V6_9PEZI|nr:HET-domain-containing protein [Venturia nashicola]
MDNARLKFAAESFVNLSYWKRLWIIQELLLGKYGLMLMAGQSIVSRYHLTSFHVSHRIRAELLEEQPWPPVLNGVLFPDTNSYNWNDHLHLYYTVCTFSSNHCQDPRDRVFGLQGLVSYDERIKVDYNLSKQEVFLLAVQCIFKAGFFNIEGKYAGLDRASRASSRLEFLQQAEEMRRRLEKLAEYMGVDVVNGEVEHMMLLDFGQARRSTRLPDRSSLRREIARASYCHSNGQG